MSLASLQVIDDGQLRLSGELNFDSVPAVWDELQLKIHAGGQLVLSLSGVTHSNSAGLAMLVEALELAREQDVQLRFEAIPESLMDLARMSNIDSFLDSGA